jgi:hypothetical protein
VNQSLVGHFLLASAPLAAIMVLAVPIKQRGGTFRVFALAALAAIFLIISSNLRDSMFHGLTTANSIMREYAPYSYAGLVLAVLGLFLGSLSRGSGRH